MLSMAHDQHDFKNVIFEITIDDKKTERVITKEINVNPINIRKQSAKISREGYRSIMSLIFDE